MFISFISFRCGMHIYVCCMLFAHSGIPPTLQLFKLQVYSIVARHSLGTIIKSIAVIHMTGSVVPLSWGGGGGGGGGEFPPLVQ